MQAATPALRGPFVRLRMDRFDARATALGLESDPAKAEYIGVDKATLSRLVNGGANPGERFIAACLARFGGTFEDYFEIVEAAS